MSSYCDRYVSVLIEGQKVPRPELDPSVEQRIERFKSIGGFAKGLAAFCSKCGKFEGCSGDKRGWRGRRK